MHAGDFFHKNVVFFSVLPSPCSILIVALCVDNSEWCFMIHSTAFKINCNCNQSFVKNEKVTLNNRSEDD